MTFKHDSDAICTCGERFGAHRFGDDSCPRPGGGYAANVFALAAPVAAAAPFRIGGIYRNRLNKDLLALHERHGAPGWAVAKYVGDESPNVVAHIRLSDGRSSLGIENPNHVYNLVPGELDAQGNPIEAESELPELVKHFTQHVAKPEASLATSTHPADLAMVSRDGPAKAKPAAITPPPVASTVKPSPFAAFTSPDMQGSGHQVNPLHASAAERSNG